MTFEDRYARLDRLLHRIAFRTVFAQLAVADMEELIFRERLGSVTVGDPVFISGLPRSGTTILLELLCRTETLASHTYRDMPFLLCPLLWNRFSRHFRIDDQPRERAHGDGIRISAKSPEAFEEMIWKRFWPAHYRSDRILPWTSTARNEEFETFFERHMRKIVVLRREDPSVKRRYVSKNNLNIARLAALPGPLRRGALLIPFRDPVQQAASMLRQHLRFLEIHEQDGFVQRYMEAIGHHEFGKGLRPVDFGGWLEDAPPPDRLEFWLRYWIAAYRHVVDHAGSSTSCICYEHVTARPKQALAGVADAVGVRRMELTSQAGRVRPPRTHDVRESEIPAPVREEARELYRTLRQEAAVAMSNVAARAER